MENLAALKVIASFGATLGEEIEASLADGKLDISDAPKFFPSLMAIGGVVEAVKAKPSLDGLSVEERAELEAFIKSDLDLANDKLELVIESSLSLALAAVGVIEMVKQLKVKTEAAQA